MDWADERVEWLFDDKKRGDGCPHGYIGTVCRDCISQALRNVQRETAEECAALHESVDPASNYERIRRLPGCDAMGAIIKYRDLMRERFGLKEKPHAETS